MATTDRNPAYSLETPFVGFGRIAAELVRSLHDRLWLQAVPEGEGSHGFSGAFGPSPVGERDAKRRMR